MGESTPAVGPVSGDGWALVEASPDAIFLVDGQGSIRYANARAEAMFGHERAALLELSIDDLVPERFRRRHRADRTRYGAEPRTREMGIGLELFARAADGHEFRVEISLSPLAVGTELCVMAAVRDITERVEAEAAARQIREILDATQDAMTIFDAETLRFTYVNKGAVDQLGYTRDELLGMTMLHIAPELDAAQLDAILEPLRSGAATSTTITTVHRNREGDDIPVEIIVQAVAAADGPPTSFVKIARDVSERQSAEASLRRAEQDLRVLEDRERIARDLHDVVIQRLFASGLTLEAVISTITDPASVARLSPIVDELDEAIKELRSTIFRLRSRSRPASARAGILAVVDDQRSALGFDPDVELDGPVDALPDTVVAELLPTLRAALANVARHARASHAWVSVHVGASLVLRVDDDGVGTDGPGDVVLDGTTADDPGAHGAGSGRTRGDGIRNAQARAIALHGTCQVGRRAGGGTTFEWTVPLAT